MAQCLGLMSLSKSMEPMKFIWVGKMMLSYVIMPAATSFLPGFL